MSDTANNPALAELLDGIADRRIRRKIQKLVECGAEAVRSLGELDSALYTREGGEDQLQIVSDAVIANVRKLVLYLNSFAPAAASEDSIDEESEIEFSSGDSMDLPLEALDQTSASEDSGDASPVGSQTDEDKWHALEREMDSMQYGLGSEIREYDRRFREALELERKGQALQDLNDAVNSLMDGVFAMMTTVYEVFVGHADPDRVIPGYRDTLSKALAVRRLLTELRQEVQELNRSIQDSQSPAMVVEMSYSLLSESLLRFIGHDEFVLLRLSDQEEFKNFSERLAEGDAIRSRLDCEGLDKYLDSLAVVSQRDVLLKHDSDLRQTIFEELDAAMAIPRSHPQRVPGIVDSCFVRAEKLFGLIEDLDSLVFKWSTLPAEERGTLQGALAMGSALRDLVELPKKTPVPEGGDFL